MSSSSNEVMNFINHFTDNGSNIAVIDKFSYGCCYWFAEILRIRFAVKDAKIAYDVVDNHFATVIQGRVYDITGDVTDKFNFIDWNSYDDQLHKGRLVRDCVLFLPTEE